MPLVTCGLGDEGVFASVIPFRVSPYLTAYTYDLVEENFTVQPLEKEFSTEIRVVEFNINIIEIEECSWPPV